MGRELFTLLFGVALQLSPFCCVFLLLDLSFFVLLFLGDFESVWLRVRLEQLEDMLGDLPITSSSSSSSTTMSISSSSDDA